MIASSRSVFGSIAVAAVLICPLAARGETCTLELKRLPPTRSRISSSDYVFRAAYPQRFSMELGERLRGIRPSSAGPEEPKFSAVIKKEPKYLSKQPLRGVARLGSQTFGFALDALPPKPKDKSETKKQGESDASAASDQEARPQGKRAKAPGKGPDSGPEQKTSDSFGFGRLHFDLNHNGDLTDDQPIDAEPSQRYVGLPTDFQFYEFPRVDLTIEIDGAKADYAFFLSVNSQTFPEFSYVTASLTPGVCREGRVTLDGKSHRLVLIDFNSNGRFDDQLKVPEEGAGPGIGPFGDMLLVDPHPGKPDRYYDVAGSACRHHVSRIVNIDGRFYDLKIAPAGDKLSITPSKVALGKVTNPAEQFRAVVYGDQGVLKLVGGKATPVELPAGQWRLLDYTIEEFGAEPAKESKKPESEKAAKRKRSLLDALVEAVMPSRAGVEGESLPRERFSTVSARAGAGSKPVTVVAGRTVVFPFGPPYKPVVTVDDFSGRQAALHLSMIGCAGESCTDMRINGRLPDAADFTITDPKGEVVHQGRFPYG